MSHYTITINGTSSYSLFSKNSLFQIKEFSSNLFLVTITVDLINNPVIPPRSTAKSTGPLRMRTIPKCSQPSRSILSASALTITTLKKLVPLLRSNRRWSRTARCWVWNGVPGLFSCSSHRWNSVWGRFSKPDQFPCWITHSVPWVA